MGARGLLIRNDLGAAELRRFAQGEADRCAALRALAIAQALEGASRADAARVVGRERQSLRDAVVRCNAEGLAGLRNRPRPGRSGKLSPAQQEELRAWVLAGPDPEADGLSSYRLVDIAAHGLLLLVPTLLHWSAPTAAAWLLILLMGLVSAVCHMLVITAFRFAEASSLAPLVYLELLGGTLLGLLVFGQLPAPATWLGIMLIVAGGLILIERRPHAKGGSG